MLILMKFFTLEMTASVSLFHDQWRIGKVSINEIRVYVVTVLCLLSILCYVCWLGYLWLLDCLFRLHVWILKACRLAVEFNFLYDLICLRLYKKNIENSSLCCNRTVWILSAKTVTFLLGKFVFTQLLYKRYCEH